MLRLRGLFASETLVYLEPSLICGRQNVVGDAEVIVFFQQNRRTIGEVGYKVNCEMSVFTQVTKDKNKLLSYPTIHT